MPAAKVFSAVGRRRGKREVDDVGEQFDRELQQDARAVTAVGLGPRRAAMLEVLERRQTVSDDLV